MFQLITVPFVFQLRLSHAGKDAKDFEINIKTISNRRNDLLSEEKDLYDNELTDSDDAVSIFTSEESVTSDGLLHTISLGKNLTLNDSFSTRPAEVISKSTQTKPEFQSSSAQTTCVESIDEKKTQEAVIQTEGKHDVSVLTDERKTKSISTETDGISKSHVATETEKEVATGTAQTETAAIYSIDKAYDVSTQTQQLVDIATSTDFDVRVIDRQNVCDKSADTDDLPYIPLIIAKQEKEIAELKLTNEETCEYRREAEVKKCKY